MRIAVEGCMHGDLDTVYKTLQYAETKNNFKIDLLLCCGDFQVSSSISLSLSLALFKPLNIKNASNTQYPKSQFLLLDQAVRNEKDLESLNVPRKYRSMNSFWKYYSGEEVAPFPTIFIGGNHEASNYMWELSVTLLTI